MKNINNNIKNKNIIVSTNKHIIKFLVIVVIMLLNFSCTNNYNEETYCSDIDFYEYTNVRQVCIELYDYYDSYLGGNLKESISCSYDDCIFSCASALVSNLELKNSNRGEFKETCGGYIIGSGGFAEIYPPSESMQQIVDWCADNLHVSNAYSDCLE